MGKAKRIRADRREALPPVLRAERKGLVGKQALERRDKITLANEEYAATVAAARVKRNEVVEKAWAEFRQERQSIVGAVDAKAARRHAESGKEAA